MKSLFRVQGSRFKVQGSGFRNLEHGTRNTEHAAIAWVLGAALALMPAVAVAQVVSDPTRPPTGYADAGPEAAGDTGGGMMLQSVMISPTQKAAIINGVVVKLGEKYGDAVLIKVTEDEVVLKSDGASQVLKLHPAVEKRQIAPAAVKKAPRREKTVGSADRAASGGAPPR